MDLKSKAEGIFNKDKNVVTRIQSNRAPVSNDLFFLF